MVFCFQCFLRPMNREEKNANKSGFIKFQVHFAVGCSRRKKCARSKFRMETKWKIEGKNSVDFSPVFLFSSMDSCVQKIYKYTSSIYSVEKFFRFWLGIFIVGLFFGRHPPNSWLDAVNKREKQVERDICLVHGSLWLCYVCFSFSFFVFHLFFRSVSVFISTVSLKSVDVQCGALHTVCSHSVMYASVSLARCVCCCVVFVFFWWFRWW